MARYGAGSSPNTNGRGNGGRALEAPGSHRHRHRDRAALAARAGPARRGAGVARRRLHRRPLSARCPSPVGMAFLPEGRLLIVEQNSAKIRLLTGPVGSAAVDVCTVPSVSTGGERGLLGIAVDPRWPAFPYLYVHHTRTGAHVAVSRFTATGDLAGHRQRRADRRRRDRATTWSTTFPTTSATTTAARCASATTACCT